MTSIYLPKNFEFTFNIDSILFVFNFQESHLHLLDYNNFFTKF